MSIYRVKFQADIGKLRVKDSVLVIADDVKAARKEFDLIYSQARVAIRGGYKGESLWYPGNSVTSFKILKVEEV